jgi:polysaccharide deacetylase 2 family uncharacterized protein YibQ
MIKMGWSSFPPEHKKSFYIGLSLYVVLVCMIGGWIWMNAADTLQDWQERIPQAEATVSMAYPGDHDAAAVAARQDNGTAFNTAPETRAARGTGAVTIIVEGLGLSEDMTQRAMSDLPAKIGFAFSPYSPGLQDWLAKAQRQDRARIIMVPMEPLTYPKDDPGPLALLTRQSRADNARHLSFILNNAPGTTAVINQMGSAFLGDKKNMFFFLGTLQARHDIFIENPGGGLPQAAMLAAQANVPYLAADLTIDSSVNRLDMHQKLLDLEKIARQRGYALGIAHPYPLTIEILKDWAENPDSRGITLVSPAELAKVQAEAKLKKEQELQEQQKQQAQQPAAPGDTGAVPQPDAGGQGDQAAPQPDENNHDNDGAAAQDQDD